MSEQVPLFHVASPTVKASLGVATLRGEGWKFIPAIPGRLSSRRLYPTPQACLPRWVQAWMRKKDYRLMTRAEAIELGIIRSDR